MKRETVSQVKHSIPLNTALIKLAYYGRVKRPREVCKTVTISLN